MEIWMAMNNTTNYGAHIWSPFSIKENLQFAPCAGEDSKGISPERLSSLYKKGQLSDCSELIIQYLYELHYLTGHLIANCFIHPKAPYSTRRFRKKGKNPYQRELQFLTHIGAVKQYCFVNVQGDRESSTIYTLTRGSRIWASKRFFGQSLFNLNQPRIFRLEPEVNKKHVGYSQILSQLSLNQFHIAMISNHIAEIERYKIETDAAVPYIYYKSRNDTKIYTISIREYWNLSVIESIFPLFLADNNDNRKHYIIIIIESMSAAEQLYEKMVYARTIPSSNRIFLFIRDNATKYVEDPLKDELAHFIGYDWNSYEICSLDV